MVVKKDMSGKIVVWQVELNGYLLKIVCKFNNTICNELLPNGTVDLLHSRQGICMVAWIPEVVVERAER